MRWGGALLTTKSGPEDRPSRLHPRLTVAHAAEADRARVSEALPGFVVHADDLWDAAASFAAERAGDRAANRSRLDAAAARALHDLETARSQRDHLAASRTELVDGAAWALELEAGLPALHEALDAARGVLEQRQAEHRTARSALDRVLEQRAAAAAAIEQADRELSELVGVGMDETGLRRELEASGQAVQAAQEAHARAVAAIEELQTERAVLDARLAELQGAPTPGGSTAAVPEQIERVRQHLMTWIDQASDAGPDPQAQALADAWTDLHADLAELTSNALPPPTDEELAGAEQRVAAALAGVQGIDASAQPLRPEDRTALDAAHETVLAAEERIGKRRGAGGAQQRLEEARAAERALLARHGFDPYLDLVLSGGRRNVDSGQRLAAERDYLAAVAERDALVAARQVSPDLEYLHREAARLQAHSAELLGVDPGEAAIPLLRAHPLLPASVVEGLRDALAVAGIHPHGVGLAETAARWVDQQDELIAARERGRAASGHAAVQLAAVQARQVALVDELAAAEHAEAHAAEQLEMSLRSVGAFEAELSVRAGEDAARLQRFAAAEQLRTQVEALSATLARAEHDAHEAVEASSTKVAEAEVAVDRAAAVLTEHARTARRLATEIPIDQRPEGDPLTTLRTLAEALEGHAVLLAPEVRNAEAAVDAASDALDAAAALAQAASTGKEGPLAEDLRDGLQQLLASHPDRLVVLDEPFGAVAEAVRPGLLEIVLDRSAAGSLVLLTEDAGLLGWAIELPADVGAAMPTDAILAAAGDPSSPDPRTADNTPTRRWAGRR